MTTFLSTNFTLEEAVFSQTASRLGITNDPTPEVIEHLKKTAYGMESVRTELENKLIMVSSWFRSAALNSAVHGAPGSGHLLGDCVDFTCPQFGTVDEIVRRILESAIPFKQVIREYGRWVHIDFGGDQRQALIIDSMGARAYA